MRVPVHGAVLGDDVEQKIIECIKKRWLTHGEYCTGFEEVIADYIGVKYGVMCNSGSSANLLALSALTAEELGERRIKPGDEVITTALAFPTTVNPILQVGAIPVFVDVGWDMSADVRSIQEAITPKTKALMLCHTMGVPLDSRIREMFRGLWFVEDCCDALGSEVDGVKCGAFGDLSTFSFYTAHHITAGESGIVCTSNPLLKQLVTSFRDWGRACFCKPGQDNACGHRFDGEDDHKYTFNHIGYNLKATDLQGAVGMAQAIHIPEFEATRRSNFKRYEEHMADLVEYYYIPLVELGGMVPFGFPLVVRDDRRMELMRYLDSVEIGCRKIFAGNIVKQPAYKNATYRISGNLTRTDAFNDKGFFVGCWHGIGVEHVDYVCEHLMRFYEK